MELEVYVQNSKSFQDSHAIISLPEQCPYCHFDIEPRVLSVAQNFTDDNDLNLYATLCCNRCKKVFNAVFEIDGTFISCHPKILSSFKHEALIQSKFPLYVQLIAESCSAEQYGFCNAAGACYRKAFEVLVKDFCIMKHPNKTDEISRTTRLGSCIQTYISDIRIKQLAERAAWLGNDAVHYKKTHTDKDINDLKQLIKLTEAFIYLDLAADDAVNAVQKQG